MRAGVGGADSPGLAQGSPGLAAGLGLEVQGSELVEADDHCLARVGQLIQLQDAVLLGLEVGVVGALPRPHRLKGDAFLAKELTQALVGDVCDHPLGDQVVGRLGQAPGRKRPAKVGWDRGAIFLISRRWGSVKVGGRPPA